MTDVTLPGWASPGTEDNRSLRLRVGFDQTSKGVISGSWTVEGTGYTREEILAEVDALGEEVLARVRLLNLPSDRD